MLSSKSNISLLALSLMLGSCNKGDISIPEPVKQGANADVLPEPVDASSSEAPVETKSPETALPVVETKSPDVVATVPEPEPVISKTDPVPTPTPTPAPTPVPTPTPTPSEPVLLLSVDPGPYILKSQGSGRCLDVPYASSEVGMQLQIYDCGTNAAASQVFMIQHVGDNYFSITNAYNKLSLEVRGGAMANSTAVQQAPYTGKSYQQFSFHKNNDGTFVIKTRSGNFAVDVVAAGLGNGTRIQIWPPNNYTNENWTLKLP